ncbi:MAG: isochorismate synthase [Candidatus Zixiibacteriota bacterium]
MAEANSTTGDVSPEFLAHIESVLETAVKNRCSLPLRVRRKVPKLSVLDWLDNQYQNQKIYWRSRDGRVEIGGIGMAFILTEDIQRVLQIAGDPGLTVSFNLSFDPESENDDIWSGFARKSCYIPDTVLKRIDDEYYIEHCLSINSGIRVADILLLIRILKYETDDTDNRQPAQFVLRLKKHSPDFAGWKKNIDAAKKAINSGRIKKIVLSRRSDFELDRSVKPIDFFRTLAENSPGTYLLFYQRNATEAFMSLTPERLFARRGRNISLEAIAATERRGADTTEDIRIEQQLLSDTKQLQEHRFVVDYIVDTMALECEEPLQVMPAEVLKLERIQHLRTPMSGVLKAVDDERLIRMLHPTPAVGGLPKADAMKLIAEIESHHRGWYAGAMGFFSSDEAEIAVGIRSLVMRGRDLSVFTGAGIVAASDAKQEWAEIDSKNILNGLL